MGQISIPDNTVQFELAVSNRLSLLRKDVSFNKMFVTIFPTSMLMTDNEDNGSQLKNLDISGAIFTLSFSIRILNSQCVKGARDVRVL